MITTCSIQPGEGLPSSPLAPSEKRRPLRNCLRVLVLHPGITPLGNDPEWFNITRLYPDMRLNGVNTQWVYSQAVLQKTLEESVPRPPKRADSPIFPRARFREL